MGLVVLILLLMTVVGPTHLHPCPKVHIPPQWFLDP